jgi:acyl-coenzyme A synthetase/AMP-(fatty) acid ligase
VNLAEQVLRSCRVPEHESVPAFLTSEGPISRAEFKYAVLAVASGLKALGVAPGEKVLVRMTNSVEFAAGFLGLVWAGVIPVLQNFQFGLTELAHIVALSRPTGILYALRPEERDPFLELTVDAARVVVTRRGLQLPSGQLVDDPTTSEPEPFDVQADDLAFVVFTSGTTGKPKGVMHAHRWLTALGDSNRARVPPQQGDVVLATGEWSFVSALGHNVLFPLRNGMTGSIMEDRASPERILATIERDRVTLVHSVATLYRRILASPGIEERFDVSSLRGANSTGEPLEEYVRDEWQRRIGCPIWEY